VAIQEGHLHIIHGLHERGYPIHDRSSYIAASLGHLDILKFLHSVGTKFDIHTFELAACSNIVMHTCGNHIEIMEYLHGLGCEYNNREVYKAAADYYATKALVWLDEHRHE
jgi:hypothetical protein